MKEIPQISIVVPLFNEEQVFNALTDRLVDLINSSNISIEVVLVDDGSNDLTPKLMEATSLKNDRFTSVFLSRNFGHQIAVSAGLNQANGSEAVLVIDGDLQDPPELLSELYKKFTEGYDVVFAIRKKRKEGFLKKLSYKIYYRLLQKMTTIKLPLDSGDFGLMSRRVVDHINNMNEESRYIRGLRSWVGFKQIGLEYERDSRLHGKSKYDFSMLLKLAFNGIFNFSELPVRLISRLGIVTIGTSVVYLIYNIVKKIFFGGVPEGYTSLLFAIILFSGVQLLSLGIIGEYVLRIFFQVKKRPQYIIDKVIKST